LIGPSVYEQPSILLGAFFSPLRLVHHRNLAGIVEAAVDFEMSFLDGRRGAFLAMYMPQTIDLPKDILPKLYGLPRLVTSVVSCPAFALQISDGSAWHLILYHLYILIDSLCRCQQSPTQAKRWSTAPSSSYDFRWRRRGLWLDMRRSWSNITGRLQ
jgi:hypothetical protein